MNFSRIVDDELKFKYQDQDEDDLDVEVLCLDGSIFVHSCVLSVPSKFLRFLVRRAQNLNPEKVQIEYKNYSKKIVKLFMDMIYNVNTIELGINDLLQLVEIVLGEDHFGEGYRWHTKTLHELTEKLENLSQTLDNEARVSLSMALARFQVAPVTEFAAKLMKDISRAEIKQTLAEIMLNTKMGSSLVSLGKEFITSDRSPLEMISRYMVLSGIQLSQTSILVEIQKLASYLLENVPENKSENVPEKKPENVPENKQIISEELFNSVLSFTNWNVFEFVTNKTGASGPTKTECIGYYKEKYKWIDDTAFFDVMKDGFQTLRIPKSGTYKFELIAPGWHKDHPGARVRGTLILEQGQKLTVALGQRGSGNSSGCGGSFAVIEMKNGPVPIFIAGGAAAFDYTDSNYTKASLRLNGHGNDRIGSSGQQSFLPNDQNNFYCAGAGFHEGPNVGELVADSVPPQSYAQGLKGGRGKDRGRYHQADLREGGFGGGGAHYYRNGNHYRGAGGGFTGGSTKISDGSSQFCDGGGAGSYSIDRNATFDHVYVEYGKCKIKFLN